MPANDRITANECNHPKSKRLAWRSASDDIKPHVDVYLCTVCGRTIKTETTTLVERLRKEVIALTASVNGGNDDR